MNRDRSARHGDAAGVSTSATGKSIHFSDSGKAEPPLAAAPQAGVLFKSAPDGLGGTGGIQDRPLSGAEQAVKLSGGFRTLSQTDAGGHLWRIIPTYGSDARRLGPMIAKNCDCVHEHEDERPGSASHRQSSRFEPTRRTPLSRLPECDFVDSDRDAGAGGGAEYVGGFARDGALRTGASTGRAGRGCARAGA